VGGLPGAIGGTLAGTITDKNIGNTALVLSTGAAVGPGLALAKSTTVINGTLFSEHALIQMAARGVPPSAVQGAVANGSRSFQSLYTKMRYDVPGGGSPGQAGLTVIKGTFTRRIVTVVKKSRNYLFE